ncbi:MAG: hydrogenase maturation protease [Actinomycetota bacterium]
MRFLVAGVGNTLRKDDAFGVRVAESLQRGPIPEGVQVMDVGIGGIHLIQELFDPVDHLVVIDAVDVGRPPGTVMVMRPDIVDVTAMPLVRQRDELADMHYATPERAFMLAKGLDVLPRSVWVVGCQPRDADGVGEGMSDEVQAAVETAMEEVRRIAREAGIRWDRPTREGH